MSNVEDPSSCLLNGVVNSTVRAETQGVDLAVGLHPTIGYRTGRLKEVTIIREKLKLKG